MTAPNPRKKAVSDSRRRRRIDCGAKIGIAEALSSFMSNFSARCLRPARKRRRCESSALAPAPSGRHSIDRVALLGDGHKRNLRNALQCGPDCRTAGHARDFVKNSKWFRVSESPPRASVPASAERMDACGDNFIIANREG
jgi:hypothetical protein